jgi:lactaldehyde reductase
MWIKYEYPEITFEDMCKVFGIPQLRKKAHFCAISSTSGTATEVTAFSIITDYDKGIKYPIADFEITPDVAIVDPELAHTMPKKLVAHTGMDALTHAIEGYTTKAAWEMTDMFHLESIRLIAKNLRGAVDNIPENREGMALAQYVAGMGFSNVGLGVDHSMAHTLSAYYGMPHGKACATLLPTVMAYNAECTGEKYRDIADAFGVEGAYTMPLEEARAAAVAAVKKLGEDVGIEMSLKNVVPMEDVDALSADALKDACTPGNPKPVTVEDIKEMFLSLMK